MSKPATQDDLIRMFLQSDSAKEMARQYQEQQLEERRGLATELADLNTAYAAEIEALNAEEAAAKESVERARAVLKEAEHGLAVATAKRWSAGNRHSMAQIRLEAQIRQLADPRIDQFMSELATLAAEARAAISTTEPVHSNIPWNRKPGHTNAPGINARLRAIQVAREAAEALKLEPLTPEALESRLNMLLASIPEIGPSVAWNY